MEAWAIRVWRLKGSIAIHSLNQYLFFIGFESPEEAIRVMENGSRIFRDVVMQLEWWTPYSGCNGKRDQEKEAWIRVVGLPLHLWTGEILKKVGDSIGGFVALDEETTPKNDFHWARILVKMNSNEKPASVNLIEGARSYELQLWWEIRPTVAEVLSRSSSTLGDPADAGEDDDRDARAKGRVKPALAVKRHTSRDEQSKVGTRSFLGICGGAGRLTSGQMSRVSPAAGANKRFEFKKFLRIRGSKWKSKKVILKDTGKETSGPNSKGDVAQGPGQIQGVVMGSFQARLGEHSTRPIGWNYQTTTRAERKGRNEEKKGMKNPRCAIPQEREVSACEKRGSQVTTSTQDQGCSEGNNIKQTLSREERRLLKDKIGSRVEEEGRFLSEPEKESSFGKLPKKNPYSCSPGRYG